MWSASRPKSRSGSLTPGQLANSPQCIDRGNRLVVANTNNSRKAKSVARLVALGSLNDIECHLEHHLGAHNVISPKTLRRDSLEPLGQLDNLGVSQTGVRLCLPSAA